MYAKVFKDSAASVKAHQTMGKSKGKGRMPLAGHPYHAKTDAELHGIIRDAGETAKLQRGMSSEGKYLDQVNDASTVLYHRKTTGAKPTPPSNLSTFSVKTDTEHMGSVAAALGIT